MFKQAVMITCMSLSAYSLYGAWSNNSQKQEECCGNAPHPMRVTARHIEANGIGYSEGYSTVEAFLSPFEPFRGKWIPFLDLRGHIFNDNQPAANGGIGLRYLGESRLWGANFYYDYRKTSREHYNQISLGLETLGEMWDFRINGYLPVGETKSRLYRLKFDRFKDHHLILSRKYQFALKGGNAEVGLHVNSFENYPLYFAAGPYALEGHGKTAWGGQLRAALDIYEYVRIEGNTSYDNVFKWIGQGQISLTIPFGKRRNVRKTTCCSKDLHLAARGVQRVDRFEIIPVDTQHKKTVAIDPATGQPYFFIFVDNQSHSLGTYESPYPTLVQAQNASSPNDIIYVFPGDGTTTGMDAGITLQDGQMLLGSSSPHPLVTTLGTITIPALTSGLPNITNPGTNVVTLANNNTVSGFNFIFSSSTVNGIGGTQIANLTTNQNNFATTIPDTNGIFLLNPSGQVSADSSSFSGFNDLNSISDGNGIYLELDTGFQLDSLAVSGSSFNNITHPGGDTGGNGIFVFVNGGMLTDVTVSNSSFNNINLESIGVVASIVSGTLTNLSVNNSSFNGISNSAGVEGDVSGGILANMSVNNSSFSGISTASSGVMALVNSGTLANLSVNNSSFNGISIASDGIQAFVDGGTLTNLSIDNSSFSGISNESDGVQGFVFSGTIANLSVNNSSFSGISDDSDGVEGLVISGTLANMSVDNSSFSGIDTNSFGIGAIIESGNSSLQILNNDFTVVSPNNAVLVNISSGTTCLELIDNVATPASNPDQYQLTQTNPGVFNRTLGSDSSTNVGGFAITGTVGSPGSCSE